MISDYRKRYMQHKMNAKNYGTPWKINYVQWRRIWSESGKWNKRGPHRGQYVMARFGDKGPYAPWNVKIITCGKNSIEAWLGRNHSIKSKTKMSVSQIGNTNPLGCIRSPETRAKLSAAHKGKKLSPAHCLKISKRMMGNQYRKGQ